MCIEKCWNWVTSRNIKVPPGVNKRLLLGLGGGWGLALKKGGPPTYAKTNKKNIKYHVKFCTCDCCTHLSNHGEKKLNNNKLSKSAQVPDLPLDEGSLASQLTGW